MIRRLEELLVESIEAARKINPDRQTNPAQDPLGYFLFGGSDIVMLFQGSVDFKLLVDPESKGSAAYEHVLMGERYGALGTR